MNQISFDTASELVASCSRLGGIHIECNQERAEAIYKEIRKLEKSLKVCYILETDKGYERETVASYLKFFADLSGYRGKINVVLEQFGLQGLLTKKMRLLSKGENQLVQMARVSMKKPDLYYIEEPLLNLNSRGLSNVLSWMSVCEEEGVCFVTVNASLRHALLMPGHAYYCEKESFLQVESDEHGKEDREEEINILKISAKSGNTILLFEPRDIDFIESQNKFNYVSVRGTFFQVTQNMDELEGILNKSGFFRCHRSYIINMQKVEQIEKISKNSYTLILNNKENSRIPLSKGRVEDMKTLFGW